MKKWTRILLALLLCAAMLSGCAASVDTPNAMESSAAVYSVPEEEAYEYDTGEFVETRAEKSMADLAGMNIVQTDRKLIYTAHFEIATEQYEDDLARILAAVEQAGGYIESESTSGTKPVEYGDSGRNTYLTARVPVSGYATFVQTVSGVGEVTSKNQQVDDISETYYDVQARIDMLELRYDKLEELLEKATVMEDIITLETEMSEILYELDGLKGTLRGMDARVEYSTVEISLCERVKMTQVVTSSKDFGTRAGDAFSGTLKGVGVFFEEFGIGFIGALPVLVLLAVVAAVVVGIVLLVRRGKRRRAARLPQQPAAQQQPTPQSPASAQTPLYAPPEEQKKD